MEALNEALALSKPEIFNTDQGSQYTSKDFITPLKDNGIKISMDSKGRALDNIFVERLWRSVKYEEVYIKAYQTARDAFQSLKKYFLFYNNERLHQALDYRTPCRASFVKIMERLHQSLSYRTPYEVYFQMSDDCDVFPVHYKRLASLAGRRFNALRTYEWEG